MSGRELRGEHRGHGRHERDERNGAVMIDRAGRRVATLLATLAALLTVVQVTAAQAEPMPIGIPGTWALRNNEEFTGAGLNTALWTPGWQSDASISGPMSNECVASKNVSQPGNGYLYLQVRKEKATCGTINVEDTGGLIESNPSDGQPGHSGFAYTYGVVEWQAYVPGVSPEGRGCPKGGCLPDWPALWSLSSTNADEIDTMEGIGTLGQACYHIHPPPGSEGPGGCLSGSYAGAWHTYAAKWEPGYVQYFYDGAQIGQVSSEVLNGTPQYLIANMVPPTSQPLVVPDEMTVNYVRVWQHPVPPSATTGSPTSLQPLQATLNGTVNSNGFDTHYYFQYGTSTSYGSTTGEVDAGSGTAAVPASGTATTLAPGTIYHYRIVASNVAGTVYGGDQAFTTPGPVEAVSTAPNVQQTEATLNGTVNPRGYDAKYYFQYGPTNGYGSSTGEADAGAGGSPVAEKATITSLEPGSEYHYRIVANSGGVVSYGSDEVLPTLRAEYVFYRGSNGGLENGYWTGHEWEFGPIGSAGVVMGSPSVVEKSEGRTLGRGIIDVFYRGTKGGLQNWLWNGQWSFSPLGEENVMAGDPSAIALPEGQMRVFFRDTKGGLYNWLWDGSKWTQSPLGEENVMAGDPSAIALPEGHVRIFFRDTKGGLYNWLWDGSKWSASTMGEENVMAGDPSAIALPNNETEVYYRDVKNGLYNWWFNGSKWSAGPLGGEHTMTGDPFAIAWPNGNRDVFFEAPKEVLYNWFYTTAWTAGPLSGEKAIAGEPSGVAW